MRLLLQGPTDLSIRPYISYLRHQCISGPFSLIIIAFLQKATIEYSSESMCPYVHECVFGMITQKITLPGTNSLNKFDIGHCQIRVNADLKKNYTPIITVSSYISALVQARKPILSIYVHLIKIYKFIKIDNIHLLVLFVYFVLQV